jgi:hypothetical protein
MFPIIVSDVFWHPTNTLLNRRKRRLSILGKKRRKRHMIFVRRKLKLIGTIVL